MRARLALDVSGQVCELREVVLRNKPAEMLAASPKGTVPVLVFPSGTVLDESLDIMLWALGCNDPERWLVPESDSLAGMRTLIAQFDSHFKENLDRYKYPVRFAGSDPRASRTAACQDLELLESRLARSAHLAGSAVSLADMAIAPFVRQFANVDASWFASLPLSAVQKWLATIVRSERFARIMRPFPVWRPEPLTPEPVAGVVRVPGPRTGT
ncbi:MAG: glutathione S-transferase [Proteobacteria bacterium]|nr:glutathione S-transferase [Pseudomonadota bacterium]